MSQHLLKTEREKRSWTVVFSECLDVSTRLHNGSLWKQHELFYMFCFHRNSWEKNWFLKLHRKPQQIASCLRPPLSPFHCVITSLSWKCGHSSSLFTYSVYQAGPVLFWFLLTPCVIAAGHQMLFKAQLTQHWEKTVCIYPHLPVHITSSVFFVC